MKKMFYVLLALLVSMVLVFGVSCDNSNKVPGGVDNPSVEEPGTDVPGGDEENPDTDNPGTGEEPGGEEGTENPGEGDDPKPEEPGDEESGNLGIDAVKVPGWADGTYDVLMYGSKAGELTVESGAFTMDVAAGPVKMTVSSNNIDLITEQTSTEVDGKNVYELNAESLDLVELGKGPASFIFTQVDDNTLTLTGFVTLVMGEFPLEITCKKLI